jgi:RNA polymerase-binding transcription factor DksA
MTIIAKPVAERKAQLLARAATLEARIGGIEAELVSHDARDWEEMATERESDEVLETMGNDAQDELRAISAALGRIESGEYGQCQTCGATISEARLDILPFTPFCKDCKK